MSRTTALLEDGADLILTGTNYDVAGSNVAECRDNSSGTLHLGTDLGQRAGFDPAGGATTNAVVNARRRELGTAKATTGFAQPIMDSGSVAIWAYHHMRASGSVTCQRVQALCRLNVDGWRAS